MFRLNSLIALATVAALAFPSAEANAGSHKGASISFSGGGIKVSSGHHGHVSIKPPTRRPYHPPVIRPIHPPIHKPICPPVFRPIVHPPIICPPPVVLPPPVICPPPVVLPPPAICLPPVILPQPPVCPPPVIIQPVPCPVPTIKPISYKPVICPPAVCPPACPPVCKAPNVWYFGMSLQLVETPLGAGLQIFSVTPNSPADVAGLQVGDVLLMAGGQSLQTLQSNEEGVALLQSLVLISQPVAQSAPQQASLGLTVLDTRSNQLSVATVLPQSLVAHEPIVTTAMAL